MQKMTKKLYRSMTKKMIGGVCGGLGVYLDIDVTVVRLIFVGIALMSAIVPMVIFYLIAWIVIPVEEEKDK
jgi:phage shock protein C